jgi:predicted GNAT family N-acyltransferase
MANWVIERLHKSHDRESFCCGNDSLDRFLKTQASQYEKKRVGRTFVAVSPGENIVRGFVTMATGSISLDALAASGRKGLPKHPIPTVHLGRLAVDQSARGQRLGETLLLYVLKMTIELAERLGVFAVDVWALDAIARSFYQKYGFLPLEDDPFHLYLPLATLAKAKPV